MQYAFGLDTDAKERHPTQPTPLVEQGDVILPVSKPGV
jgi:hypothetical protein